MRLSMLLFAICLVPLHVLAASTDERPLTRIVSLAPHLTELAFVAGAGDRIVATVEYSDHPEGARKIPRIGDAFLIDLERLVALSPDAVLAWDTGTPVQTIERVRELGLHVELFSTQRLADVGQAVRRLGELAGTQSIAEPAAAAFEQEIRAVREEYRSRPTITVFLEVNERPLYTVNGKHIMSEIAALCGGENIFARLNDLAPMVGLEAVIAANPQAIVVTDATVSDGSVYWARWKHMRAVRAGNVFTLPPDDLARATTRLVQGARTMCRSLDTARDNIRKLER